jgi:hypothetical protein
MHPIITTIPGVYQERFFNFPKPKKTRKGRAGAIGPSGLPPKGMKFIRS